LIAKKGVHVFTDLERNSRMKINKFSVLLSEQEKENIDHEIAKFPHKRHACLDALLAVQKHRGYISDDALMAVAEYLDMSPTELDGIATFYNLIYRKPVGRKVIRLCDSISCHILDYQSIKKVITDNLQINFGETTNDGDFTLLPAQCLGVCEQAPACMINDEVHANLDKEKILALIKRGS
jgi:NADH-quinone oxidoreductase subunit E